MGSLSSENTAGLGSNPEKMSLGSGGLKASSDCLHGTSEGYDDLDKGFWSRKWEQVFPGGYSSHCKTILKMCIPLVSNLSHAIDIIMPSPNGLEANMFSPCPYARLSAHLSGRVCICGQDI